MNQWIAAGLSLLILGGGSVGLVLLLIGLFKKDKRLIKFGLIGLSGAVILYFGAHIYQIFFTPWIDDDLVLSVQYEDNQSYQGQYFSLTYPSYWQQSTENKSQSNEYVLYVEI